MRAHAETLPLAGTPGRAATWVTALATLFVACVLSLHVLRPDLAPSAHMLSEYALGPGGRVMWVAFMALSGMFVALLILLRGELRGVWGRLGQAALLLAATGSAMGGLFPMDPVGTPPEQYSSSGRLHGVAFMIGGPGALLAATFVNISLVRLPAWRQCRLRLLWTGVMVWVVYIAFSAAIGLLMSGNQAVEHAVGWLNRVLVLSWVIWAIVVARRAPYRDRRQDRC